MVDARDRSTIHQMPMENNAQNLLPNFTIPKGMRVLFARTNQQVPPEALRIFGETGCDCLNTVIKHSRLVNPSSVIETVLSRLLLAIPATMRHRPKKKTQNPETRNPKP